MILSILQNVPQKTITNKPAIQKQSTTQRSISTELRFKFIIHEHQLDYNQCSEHRHPVHRFYMKTHLTKHIKQIKSYTRFRTRSAASAPNQHLIQGAVGEACGAMLCNTTALAQTSQPLSPTRIKNMKKKLEQADGLAHGAFDVEGFNVLPVLFEERNKEVDA